MFKRTIRTLYEVSFNYFTKKDGYDSKSHIVPSCVVGFTILFLLLAFACMISLITGQPFLSHRGINKGLVFLVTSIYLIIVYYTLFHGFKLEKHGNEPGHLFDIDKQTSTRVKYFVFALGDLSAIFIFLTVAFVNP